MNIPKLEEILESPTEFIEKKNRFLSKFGEKAVVHTDASVHEKSVLEGPAYIGPGCEIRPFAHIRPGTYLEGGNKVGQSEVKNSILLKGANVPHFNYVGDSILGRGVNLGAGTMIANQRLDREAIKVDAISYAKFGALLGNNVRTGINVPIYPGELIPSDTYLFMDLDTGERIQKEIQ